MSETTAYRPEPRGCTLADLIALTLGAAIAASLYWYSGATELTTIAGRAAPTWYIWANSFIELLQKSCVALTPVILQRRWRTGGPLRPVEYLPILTALDQIFLSALHWPVFGILYKGAKQSSGIHVDLEAWRAWNLGQLAIGFIAILLVVLRRKRPPDWIAGFLVALAWGRMALVGGIYYQEWGNEWITANGWPLSTVRLLSATVVQGPPGLVVNLPLAMVLVDLGGAHIRRRSWVEWVAAWLTLPLPLFYQARFLAGSRLGTRPLDFVHATHLGVWVASFGLAYLMARAFEPAWRWFLEGSTK